MTCKRWDGFGCNRWVKFLSVKRFTSRLAIVACCGFFFEFAHANEEDLCVTTRDGVVHISSASTPGTSCRKRFIQPRNKSDAQKESLELLTLQTPLARFSTADKSGALSENENSPLSGSAGAALEIWMRLNERATDAAHEPFVVIQYGRDNTVRNRSDR
ncbi:MAG: hypothetical protein ACPGQS_09445, partial [Bradymonadia bacterium]